MNKCRKFWETCRANYAHLKENWFLVPGVGRGLQFDVYFMDMLDFKDKTIVDYGCGGGYFGLYLLDHFGIKKYIGVDIAERSLIATKNMLSEKGYTADICLDPKYSIDTTVELYKTPVEFKNLKSDILISIACIQHFPAVKYLRLFLENINRSGIKDVVLSTRYVEETTCSGVYEDVEGVLRKVREEQLKINPFGTACLTNSTYIGSILDNYNLVKESEFMGSAKSQYLIYKKKENMNDSPR